MILSLRVGNYLVYDAETELSLTANMKIKKFSTNVFKSGNFNVVKAAAIYGANNVGKTCLVQAAQAIKNIMLGQSAKVMPNIFAKNRICSWGITFLYESKAYKYDIKFDAQIIANVMKGFVYESLSEVLIDDYGNQKDKLIFIKDAINNIYKFPGNDKIEELMRSIALNNIFIYTLNSSVYSEVDTIKSIFINFANSIEVLYMENLPLNKTIEILKNNNEFKDKVVELIKKADLDISDYKYVKPTLNNIDNVDLNSRPHERILQAPAFADDILYLKSNHKGVEVSSLLYDSTGTKKIVSLAGYIVEAIACGKTLIIDELDSSLHFKITRAIAALFNNDLNLKGQLIFTVHDITLLDCKKLFRKDQIWFADKDDEGAYLYSLDSYTAQDGVRAELDLVDHYRKGYLGAVPEPDLISVLLGGN